MPMEYYMLVTEIYMISLVVLYTYMLKQVSQIGGMLIIRIGHVEISGYRNKWLYAKYRKLI